MDKRTDKLPKTAKSRRGRSPATRRSPRSTTDVDYRPPTSHHRIQPYPAPSTSVASTPPPILPSPPPRVVQYQPPSALAIQWEIGLLSIIQQLVNWMLVRAVSSFDNNAWASRNAYSGVGSLASYIEQLDRLIGLQPPTPAFSANPCVSTLPPTTNRCVAPPPIALSMPLPSLPLSPPVAILPDLPAHSPDDGNFLNAVFCSLPSPSHVPVELPSPPSPSICDDSLTTSDLDSIAQVIQEYQDRDVADPAPMGDFLSPFQPPGPDHHPPPS